MPLLSVDEIPQWGSQANRYRTDCGAASIAMLLSFYGKLGDLTVDYLAAETTLVQHDNGLTPDQLCQLAAKHGVQCHVNVGVSIASICNELDHGRPVIPLIANRDISERLDVNDKTPGLDGHFFIVIGYEGENFIVNDPDAWEPHVAVGTQMRVPFKEMDKALEDTNAHRQAVFVNPYQVPPPPPVPPYQAITTDILNIRTSPQIANNKIGQLPKGAAVTVTGEASGEFVPIWIVAWVGARYVRARG